MIKVRRRFRALTMAVFLSAGVLIAIAAKAGKFLIVDAPQPSDVILVLAGESDHRPERALQLLAQGLARRMVLDVPANMKIYNFTQIQLAEKYIQGLPQATTMSVCPIHGLSTLEEANDARKCVTSTDARVLIVTSDFHSRRALNIFRHAMPERAFSVAASRDEEQYGARWWAHRQWAKTFAYEWLRYIWWECVDRWR